MKYFNTLFFSILLLLFFSCKTEGDVNNNIESNTTKIIVGVFNGNGASAVCVLETLEALKMDNGIDGKEISAFDISSDKINEFDAIIFPGGSGSKEVNNLGKMGVKNIHKFIKENGKGVVGICAGAYMMMSTDGYPSLQLSNVNHIDRAHYNRGRGLVEFTLTEKGYGVFPELKDDKMFLQYYDGPVMQLKDSSVSSYTELGKYVTDITPDNYAPSGIAPRNTFLFNENIGKGKIVAIAGHPESTPGMRWMVPRMVRIATNSELVSYDSFFVRPEINDKAILFDRALRKLEKKLFWNLMNDTSEVVISAMNELHSYRSRPAVRWTIGLLRHEDAKVRERAAYLLKETEYSFALPDLETVFKTETNMDTKNQMEETIKMLKF